MMFMLHGGPLHGKMVDIQNQLSTVEVIEPLPFVESFSSEVPVDFPLERSTYHRYRLPTGAVAYVHESVPMDEVVNANVIDMVKYAKAKQRSSTKGGS